MRKTVANWQELCNFVKEHLDKDEHLRLTPISWEGWQKKDRKTKDFKREVDKDKVVHIVFDVEVY